MKISMARWAGLLVFVSLPIYAQVALDQAPLGSAREKVERLHDSLIESMQQAEQANREALLSPVVAAVFDVNNIARISIGRTWRTISAEQQQALVEDLTALIVATYADRFDAYNDQQFLTREVVAVRTGPVVKTQLIRIDDEPVTLDYYLRDGGIFNVVADGVSDLSLRRADYNSIIKQQGFEALLQHIADKIDEARNPPPP